MNTIGSVLSIIPAVSVIGGVLSGIFNGFDSIFGGEMLNINIPKNIAEDSVLRIARHATSELFLLRHQLETARTIFQNQNLSNFESILQKINITLIGPEKQSEYSSTGVLKFVKESVNEIDNQLTDKIKEMEKNIEKNGGTMDEQTQNELEYMKKGKAILGAGDTALKIFTTMQGDQEKINEVNKIIEKLEHQIEMLNLHRQIIDNVIAPRLVMIEQTL